MTGLDCLREEMMARGATKQQIESKAVAMVLDIIANTGDKYTKICNEEQLTSKNLEDYQRQLNNLISNVKALERKEREALERKKHLEDYIDEFNKSILECESPDGRDAMRTAQMFVNSVNVNTKYDNTAYIIGLAAILSKGKINPIEKLKKINKKLFDIVDALDPSDPWTSWERV